MIFYVTKDITTVDVGIVAHGCNAQGVMGSGVARFLRDKYPQIFPKYHDLCLKAREEGNEDNLLGQVDFVQINNDLVIANCFTQHLYGYDKGKYAHPDAILRSMQVVYMVAQDLDFSVYLPKIGAGRGGLDWATEVEPIILNLVALNPNVDTYVCTWTE